MALILRLLDLLNRVGPNFSVLPFKFVGILTVAGKRVRIKVAVRHDLDWDDYFSRSWRKRGYWYHWSGNRKIGTLQVMDMIAEWRIGKYSGES